MNFLRELLHVFVCCFTATSVSNQGDRPTRTHTAHRNVHVEKNLLGYLIDFLFCWWVSSIKGVTKHHGWKIIQIRTETRMHFWHNLRPAIHRALCIFKMTYSDKTFIMRKMWQMKRQGRGMTLLREAWKKLWNIVWP